MNTIIEVSSDKETVRKTESRQLDSADVTVGRRVEPQSHRVPALEDHEQLCDAHDEPDGQNVDRDQDASNRVYARPQVLSAEGKRHGDGERDDVSGGVFSDHPQVVLEPTLKVTLACQATIKTCPSVLL